MIKVLLVDDEVFARKGLSALIPWSDLGYEIVGEADDGEEALKLIEALRPDVVVTDIRMPVMDGLKLIGHIREQGADSPKFIIISGYNDFKYAQQAVRYGVQDFILKPIDEDEMSGALTRIKELLEKEREGRGAPRSELDAATLDGWASGAGSEADAAAYGIRPDAEYACLLIERNNRFGGHDRESGDRSAELKRSLGGHLALERQSKLYDVDGSTFGLLVAAESPGGAACDWETLATTLLWAMPGDVRPHMRVYVGKPGIGAAGAAESHRTAKEAMQYKYALDERQAIVYEQTAPFTLCYRQSDSKLNAELMEAVEEADEPAMLAAIDKLFETFTRQRFAPESVQAAVASCVLGVTRVVRELEGDENELASLKAMMQWSNEPKTLAGLKDMIVAFVQESVAYIADKRKSRAKGGIHKVKQYIESHYHQNMSLKSISKTFFMNPVYLGQLFKKTYGVYFNDFLLDIRIQEAKRLLRQTDLKVYEVAERVGFGNPDYFVTQFEKVEHKTPTEYKNGILTKN